MATPSAATASEYAGISMIRLDLANLGPVQERVTSVTAPGFAKMLLVPAATEQAPVTSVMAKGKSSAGDVTAWGGASRLRP